jgi:hypothetical protein
MSALLERRRGKATAVGLMMGLAMPAVPFTRSNERSQWLDDTLASDAIDRLFIGESKQQVDSPASSPAAASRSTSGPASPNTPTLSTPTLSSPTSATFP